MNNEVNKRLCINTHSHDGTKITLVPLHDGLTTPTNPPLRDWLDQTIRGGNGQYAIVETHVFGILLNMGLSPMWSIDTKTKKPKVWIPETETSKGHWMFVARLVANARWDETISCIDGNNYNLRYDNLQKKKADINPDRHDRDDIIKKDDKIYPIKFMSTYNDHYGQPTFMYN